MFKKCPKCGNEKHESEYSKRSQPPYYLRSWCKKCTSKISNNYRKAHREERIEYCKKWHSENKDRSLELSQKWKLENKSRANSLSRDWYYNNQEYAKELSRKWRKLNIEKAREATRQWFKNNPIRNRGYVHKRRALIKKDALDITEVDWMRCLAFFDYKDAYTGKKMKMPTMDHIVPISKGGIHAWHNIVPCEKEVNSSKNNNDMEKWYRQQEFFSLKRLEKMKEWVQVYT